MAIKSYFFDALRNQDGTYDRTYSSDSFSNWLKLIVGNGVFPNPSTNLQVQARTGFNIIVGSGSGWIDGHKMDNDTYYPITIDGSDVLNDRIDRVIFYLDYEDREMGIDVLKGTPSSDPVAPELTVNDTRVELCLAEIAINHQVTQITQADITDTRPDSDVCGWVACIVDQVDTSTLFQQWQTAYANYYATIKTQLDNFMAALTEELRVNTYVVSFDKFVMLTGDSSSVIPLDMTDYDYENTDIIQVFINGLEAEEYRDYSIDTSSEPVEVTVNITGTYEIENFVKIHVLKSIIGIEQQIEQI